MELTTDAAGGILKRNAELYEGMILNYAEKFSDNMVGRKILSVRKAPKDKEIDVISQYDRQGAGAIVAAKGAIPAGSKVSVKATSFPIYQILDGFVMNEKDMTVDPKLQKKNVDLCMKNIHRTEDDLCINGDTTLNLNGIADVASNNALTTSTNHGAWDGTEANDIHADYVGAIGLMDTDFDAAFTVGNPVDMNYLNTLDSERQPYWKTLIDLFPAARKKEDFIFKSNRCTAATVFLGPTDSDAAELVVAENPTVRTLSLQSGGNYPVEIYEWVTPEIHNTDSMAQIATG